MSDSTTIFKLPCEPVWEDSIYQLEVTDPVLGYNPATNQDGHANRQALQLGNRTLYLRKIIEAFHPDGKHSLTNADFVDGIQIPESALRLDYGTQQLMDGVTNIETSVVNTMQRSEDILQVTLSFSGAMLQLIPFSQEYSGNACAFELFTDNFSLRSFNGTKIIREIRGDDSLDVESTEHIREGEMYILANEDGSDAEEVIVRSVLTEHRIRFTSELRYTRNYGIMAATNLIPNGDGATAFGDFTYISDNITALKDAVSGRIIVRRDGGDITCQAWYRPKGHPDWFVAAYQETREFADGTVDDVFAVPDGETSIKLVYSGGIYPYNVYYIAVQPIKSLIWIEDIRNPEIVSATLEGDCLTVQGNEYASLYAIPQASLEIKVSTEHHFTGEHVLEETKGAVTEGKIQITQEMLEDNDLFVRLRYKDIEGNVSRWSAVAVVIP